ncbi:MFS transporter, partial [Acinetobacter baumannii]
FGIGLLKEYTGNMAAGLYFLSIVMLFGLILTYIVYAKLERQKTQTVNIQKPL